MFKIAEEVLPPSDDDGSALIGIRFQKKCEVRRIFLNAGKTTFGPLLDDAF